MTETKKRPPGNRGRFSKTVQLSLKSTGRLKDVLHDCGTDFRSRLIDKSENTLEILLFHLMDLFEVDHIIALTLQILQYIEEGRNIHHRQLV